MSAKENEQLLPREDLIPISDFLRLKYQFRKPHQPNQGTRSDEVPYLAEHVGLEPFGPYSGVYIFRSIFNSAIRV